ncbi:hypothetical protein [Dyella caseinilytica]|uniref:Uncharacterized protein n=1 Tax=Dyella caseinilytica TaxID=1849581 RepID=A0ABX7GWV1_9GAMM|nr:hypothetical protein [Dyella caseinilytica]QRN54780.1 hypothetical protein ISN74_05335 [Dyella caseinilytica]GFZ96783.1 hypothetical protein GCM10011408_16540 [Dyella caseinilytica]
MNSYASKSNANQAPRAFARINAMEVTKTVDEQNNEELFLSVVTTFHPEPEFGMLA